MALRRWNGTNEVPLSTRMPVPELTDHLRRALDDLDYPVNLRSMRPVVLPQSSYQELFTATRRILGLLRRALLDSAPDAPSRMAALGMSEEHYPLWVDSPWEEEYATCMARPDISVTVDGPKFLEMNVGSGIGGVVETHVNSLAWQTAFGGADQAPFTGYDPLSARAELFARAAREFGVTPAVAVVGTLRDLGSVRTTRYFDLQVASLQRHGLQAEFFEPEDLLDGLGLPGTQRYALGLRHLTVYDWTRLGLDLSPIRTALDEGCVLLAPQSAYLIANKQVLGWISEGRPWMTEDDRAVVDRYVPWTRIVGDQPTEWRGITKSIPDLLLAHPEKFVLKPGLGLGGHGVVFGRSSDETTWHDAVAHAVRTGGYIAQEHLDSVPHRMELAAGDGSGTYEDDVFPLFSPYLFDDRPAGCLVRYLPPGRDGLISVQGTGALPSIAVAARP
ncbi:MULTISPECIES: hypothetical protein [unclassified Streptomyces]|uniref:hypothetical protein n=1 Tax=unclassified Streptomyces TaxID=2593676 RepID=UPI0036E8EB40